MKFTLSNTIAALFLVLGIFLSAGTPVHAQTPIKSGQTLTLPNQLYYAGLTFAEPLTYETNKQVIFKQETLTFSIPHKIAITPAKSNNETLVILPTTAPTTLSVLPSQAPPSAFKTDEDEEPTPTPIKSGQSPAKSEAQKTVAGVSTTPTAAPTAATAVVSTNTSTGGGLDAEKLFNMSNAYRQARGLAPFQKDERSCSLAASRAPEVNAEVAGGHMHSGLKARALPYWNTENIITMRTEEEAFNWWVNDKIHHDAIVGNYTYSCVACAGNACAQEFTNFQPK